MEEELEVDLDEPQMESGYVMNVDAPDCITYTALDSENRCTETCTLDLGGDFEDVIASAQDLIDFLKKFGKTHHFEATES